MQSTIWVGRVRSTIAPSILEKIFSKVGKVTKVETGFGGFAFVEFENAEDADKACEEMTQTIVPYIGEITVAKATVHGYENAWNKRELFSRAIGRVAFPGGQGQFPRRRSRSPSHRKPWHSRSLCRRQRRSWHKSRSGSRIPRRTLARCRSSSARAPRDSPPVRWASPRRCRSRSHKRSWSRSALPRNRKAAQKRQNCSRSEPCRGPSEPRSGGLEPQGWGGGGKPQGGAGAEAETRIAEWTDGSAVAGWTEDGADGAGCLGPEERGAAVSFFDGADVCDLLLEGAASVRASDCVPSLPSGFPHAFQGLSREGAMALLTALSCFVCGEDVVEEGNKGAGRGERTAESRQKLMVDATGRRVMCKTLLVDGKVLCSAEEKM